MIAGQDRRMAGASLGRGVALIAIVKNGTLSEPGKTLGKMRAVFVPQVGGKLVDRDHDEQLWGAGRKRRAGGLVCGRLGASGGSQ
jgi:hypothetical protein